MGPGLHVALARRPIQPLDRGAMVHSSAASPGKHPGDTGLGFPVALGSGAVIPLECLFFVRGHSPTVFVQQTQVGLGSVIALPRGEAKPPYRQRDILFDSASAQVEHAEAVLPSRIPRVRQAPELRFRAAVVSAVGSPYRIVELRENRWRAEQQQPTQRPVTPAAAPARRKSAHESVC